MNTTALTGSTRRSSPLHRFFGVVAESRSYRNLAYLLLGLPLGTLWFTLLVTAISVGVSMLVVFLLGIPILLGTWYAVRAFGNVERATADALLDVDLPMAPISSPVGGNLWRRLRGMSEDRSRWRELAFLLLRFPAGIATFTAAVTSIAVPVTIAYAPFHARFIGDGDFGDWFYSSEVDDIASGSPWSWLLVPFGVLLLFVAFHAMNGVARACGRWTTAWLS
jgi:hypothetical protein